MDNPIMDRARNAYWDCNGNTEQSIACVVRTIQEYYEDALISAHIENERLAVQLENAEAA